MHNLLQTSPQQRQGPLTAFATKPNRRRFRSPPMAPRRHEPPPPTRRSTALLDGLGVDLSIRAARAQRGGLRASCGRDAAHGSARRGRRAAVALGAQAEIRLDTTLLLQRDNNPLKFFPDGDSALQQMLNGRSSGLSAGAGRAGRRIRRHPPPRTRGTRPTRPVTFRCQDCGELVTEERAPGPTPLYCRPCGVLVKRAQTRDRVEAYRRRQDEARNSARGSVGRPRKD